MHLSIIIPTYNVDQYLAKCIKSCLHQDISHSEYEIIVVNDGSSDNSLYIAEEFARKYNNIIVVSQENQGLSAARNKGLEVAKGNYIWFVDSDDYISKNCLKELIEYFKDDIDLLQIQARHVYADGTPDFDLPSCDFPYGASGVNILELGILSIPAPFSIYKRKYLIENNLFFTKGIYHEDCEFKPKALYFAKKVASINIVCYNYLQRTSGSITSIFKAKHGYDILYVNNSLISFCENHHMTKKCRLTIYRLIGTLMNSILNGIGQLKKDEKNNLITEIKKNNHIYSYMLKSRNIKYMIEGIILRYNIKVGIKLYKILN